MSEPENQAPFSAKAGRKKSPSFAYSIGPGMLNQCSNIGSQINHFVEQNAGPAQHALDLVGSFRNRTLEVSSVSSLASGGW